MQLYSYLTGPDDESFCNRICEKINNGWELYGNPTLTFDGKSVIAGQALTKNIEGEYYKGISLKETE
ncbi:MAG: DUF1737 domain-containing protein [Desulfobacterales bacterium]|nr:DUF1737 domain-containing protein [Desulfobacterales bacterium]